MTTCEQRQLYDLDWTPKKIFPNPIPSKAIVFSRLSCRNLYIAQQKNLFPILCKQNCKHLCVTLGWMITDIKAWIYFQGRIFIGCLSAEHHKVYSFTRLDIDSVKRRTLDAHTTSLTPRSDDHFPFV